MPDLETYETNLPTLNDSDRDRIGKMILSIAAVETALGGGSAITLVTTRYAGTSVTIPADCFAYGWVVVGTAGTVSDGTNTFAPGYAENVGPIGTLNLNNAAITLTGSGGAAIRAFAVVAAA